MVTSKRICPKCNGTKIATERRLNGNSTCKECGFKDKSTVFTNQNDKPLSKIMPIHTRICHRCKGKMDEMRDGWICNCCGTFLSLVVVETKHETNPKANAPLPSFVDMNKTVPKP